MATRDNPSPRGGRYKRLSVHHTPCTSRPAPPALHLTPCCTCGRAPGDQDNLRANEGKLKAAVEDAQSKLTVSEQRYQKLKDHAEGRIHSANESIAGVRDEFSTQIKALQAKLKKADMDNNRLARQVEAKEQDNKELTAICDDLVAQLDGKGA